MAELKTKLTSASVEAFLDRIKDRQRREDCHTVLRMMKDITRTEPAMWGSSIVGFGTRRYVYASGREGDWPVTGFSPRAQNLTLYIMTGFDRYPELMSRLGKHSTGKVCLYVRRLSDLHLPTLRELIQESVKVKLATNARSSGAKKAARAKVAKAAVARRPRAAGPKPARTAGARSKRARSGRR